jgi:hypothetical protein
MNAEQMQQSVRNETRLTRIMVVADLAARECDALIEEGYDPEKMGKYGKILDNMTESLSQRINHERQSRSEAQREAEQPKEPGIILPFSRNGQP